MGRVERRPVVENGKVVVGQVAPLFVRADHRIATAYHLAQFAQTIRQLLDQSRQMEPLVKHPNLISAA